MDQQQSFRSNLVTWLGEIVPFGKFDTYIRKTKETFDSSPDAKRGANSVRYIFCTDEHQYSIYAHPDYLGAGASARKQRPGEDWTRGNDLPDGKFCRETWESIKDAIIRYEMVKLDTIYKPKEIPGPPAADPTPVEKEYFEAHAAAFQARMRLQAAERALAGADKRDEERICGLCGGTAARPKMVAIHGESGGQSGRCPLPVHEARARETKALVEDKPKGRQQAKCDIEFNGGKCPCTCLHTTHPVANHAEGCPERPSCGDSLCRVEHTPMEDITRHDTRCPESGPGWA